MKEEEEAQPPIVVTLVDGVEPIINGRQFIGTFDRYLDFVYMTPASYWYRKIGNYVVPPNCTAIIAGTAFTLSYERGSFTIESREDGEEHRVDLPTADHPRLAAGVTVTLTVRYPVQGVPAIGTNCFCHWMGCGHVKNHYKGPAQFPVYAAYE